MFNIIYSGTWVDKETLVIRIEDEKEPTSTEPRAAPLRRRVTGRQRGKE
jgi:hypothetical protein